MRFARIRGKARFSDARPTTDTPESRYGAENAKYGRNGMTSYEAIEAALKCGGCKTGSVKIKRIEKPGKGTWWRWGGGSAQDSLRGQWGF